MRDSRENIYKSSSFLLFTVLGMMLFGLLMVYSASYIYAQERFGDGFVLIRKQLIYSALGLFTLGVVSRIPYRYWQRLAYPGLLLAVFLLVLIFVPGIGEKAGGARRWLHLGPFRFQPAEYAKFAVILFSARQMSRQIQNLNFGSVHGWRQVSLRILPFVPLIPILGLLLFQPDFGTTVLMMMTFLAILFLAGLPWRYLGAFLLLISGLGLSLIFRMTYRKARLMTFLDPWQDPSGKGFQILQSFVGLHEGGLWGVGLGNGKEKLFYLPEAHNDFILSVIGEELGWIGIVAVVFSNLHFVYWGLKIAWESEKRRQDHFGMLLAAGMSLALGFQSAVNSAVALGLLPTKGLTLPFMSYGGSALWVDCFMVGVLLSIARHSYVGMGPSGSIGGTVSRRPVRR